MTTWGKSNRKKILYHNTNGSVLDFGISKRIAPVSGPDDKITLRFNSKELCLYLTKVRKTTPVVLLADQLKFRTTKKKLKSVQKFPQISNFIQL